MKKKLDLVLSILIVLLLVVIVAGITYAVYTWQTIDEEESNLGGSATCFDIVYTKGQDIGSNEDMEILHLGSSYLDGLSTTVKMKLDSNCDIELGVGTIYLNTESASTYFIDNEILHYEVLVDDVSVSSGIVNTLDSIPIYSGFDITSEEIEITVYIWINGSNVSEDIIEDVLNSVYKGNITASAESR